MLADVQTLDVRQGIHSNTNESMYCTTAQKSNDETQRQGRFCLITARGGGHVPAIRRDNDVPSVIYRFTGYARTFPPINIREYEPGRRRDWDLQYRWPCTCPT